MTTFLAGVVVTALFAWFLVRVKERGTRLGWMRWTVSAGGFACTAFVLSAVGALLAEGTPRAALGSVAVVWLAFVFRWSTATRRGIQ